MVDNSRIDQVLEHHQHVLRRQYPPTWFNVTASPQRTTTNAPTEVTPAQREVPRQASMRDAAELQRRRYGH